MGKDKMLEVELVDRWLLSEVRQILRRRAARCQTLLEEPVMIVALFFRHLPSDIRPKLLDQSRLVQKIHR